MNEERIDPRKILMLFDNPTLLDYFFIEKAHEVSVQDILLFPDMFLFAFGTDVAKTFILEVIKSSETPDEMYTSIVRGRKILEGLARRFKEKEKEGKIVSPTDAVTEISEAIVE